MAEAGSYRFTGSITVGASATKVSGEFQAPDRLHELITTAQGQMVEVVFVGGRAFIHDRASGRWTIGTTPAGSAAAPSAGNDPRTAFLMLQGATNISASPDGGTMQFSLKPDVAAQIVRLPSSGTPVVGSGTAVLSGGDLSSLSFSVRSGAQQLAVVLGYSDVGHGPAVSVPAA
jgi:hypothetical protein